MKLKYYFNNNGQHYFQRSIPRALQRFYGDKKIVRHKLPSVHSQMLLEMNRLAHHYDQHFKALKSGEGGTPSQIQEQAVAYSLVTACFQVRLTRQPRFPMACTSFLT
ncbi:hypothetical protein [Polynucleobacter sphagniphilus]|uniref:hypothetical protein n=1 Tax=Polynucleobacter sphagniphilus TaxID=1743169 RepID=UPI00247511AC|nr:hypothetical protein [Polynucleobacter sphagniphilus]MDH6525146.1 hypothetical protein [Polynucleobacter sphagniphilus]